MAPRQRADRQKEKEKREKIILVVLVAVLVIVGAIELPSMLKKKSPTPAPVAVQTTSGSTATSAGTPNAGGLASAPANLGTLPSTPNYQPGQGQLQGFNLFGAHDPFGNVPTQTGPTTPASTQTSTPTTTATTTTPKGYSFAQISVNGASETVPLGDAFPAGSPAFVLDSISVSKIVIGVNGGSFAGGQSKLAILKGKSVTLVNTVDGTRYTIRFVKALSSAAAGPSPSLSTPAPVLSSPSTGTTTTSTTTTTTSTTP
jgi:hypothetical protein